MSASNYSPSFRAQLLTRRTYNRPIGDSTTQFETWTQTVDRVIDHQRWLWERALGSKQTVQRGFGNKSTGGTQVRDVEEFIPGKLNAEQEAELAELRQLMLDRKTLTSGRTLWLGGTDIAKTREASQFNCSFLRVETVYDVVDAFWLLLQGCGVGFEGIPGTLNGFTKPVEVEIVRSRGLSTKGREHNVEEFFTREDGKRVWRLSVGDSAEAWAKAAGKLVAMKKPVDIIVLDFSEIRRGGIRLRGYGWISSGDETIHKAFKAIAEIMGRKAGQLLNRIDILDIMNWLGTTLSSRRSAEICVMPADDLEAETFALAKKDRWTYRMPDGSEWEIPAGLPFEKWEAAAEAAGARNNRQREMSNNTLIFFHRPTKMEIKGIFATMMEGGGSEPGFLNGTSALAHAAWFKGCNPCAEILLGNKSFCNLVETDLGKFLFDFPGLLRAIYLAARANYRQTCVDLRDGVLSVAWHELNEFLRLCGVGLTGIVRLFDHLEDEGLKDDIPFWLQSMRKVAHEGANCMADELGLPRPKAITTVKPSGTLGKIMDTTEGVHRPMAKYIFNNVNFSIFDPLVEKLKTAGYKCWPNPADPTGMLVRLPVAYEGVKFTKVTLADGRVVELNRESAIAQLERYKLLMDHYVDHNCSITVYYDPSEVPEVVNWLDKNWDSFVGVSWLYRNDPTKSAEDLGYLYLPQEVATAEEYYEYVSKLLWVDLDGVSSLDDLLDADCATGSCPIR